MDLTPELLLEAKFAPARRGYDMNEVDDFLERCAEGLDVLLTRLKAEFDRAERAEAAVTELRESLTQARGGAAAPPATEEPDTAAAGDDVAPAAERESAAGEPVVPEADAPAASPSVEEPMRILIAAERTAEAAIAEARAEAERIRAEAESVASTQRSEAEALLARSRSEAEAEARRAGEEARRTIEAEVLSLREDRDALTDDVRALRRWLDEQRARVRTTVRDLQRLIDDPDALRELPVPELHEDASGQAADAEDVADAEDATDDEAGAAGDSGSSPEMADRPRTIFDDDEGGEPTQSVPVAEGLRVFDDEADDDTPFSPVSSNGADTTR